MAVAAAAEAGVESTFMGILLMGLDFRPVDHVGDASSVQRIELTTFLSVRDLPILALGRATTAGTKRRKIAATAGAGAAARAVDSTAPLT